MGVTGYLEALANQELEQIARDIKNLRKLGIEIGSVPLKAIDEAKNLPELVEAYMGLIDKSSKSYNHTR